MLVVTSCPWTGRAIESAVADAGLAALRASDVNVAEALCTGGAIDALILDERGTSFATSRVTDADRLLASVRALGIVPTVLLARDPATTERWMEALERGIWTIVPFPLGAPWWVRQLALWAGAARATRRDVERGLVDAASGLYNRRGLLRRAGEIEGDLRRRGGRLACAVFDVQVPPEPVREPGAPDAVAAAVAEVWRHTGRAGDALARTGAYDYAVVAPNADAAGVQALVERMRHVLGERLGAVPSVQVGACDLPNVETSLLSASDLLAHAANRRAPR